MSDRPSWDAVWMETADTISARSLCNRAQIGAVIVSADNIVRAASYNGPPPGFDHGDRNCTMWCRRATADELSPTYEDCWSTHAEMSAIARADRSTLEGATMYVTGAMCMPCAKVIPQTGISRIVHRVEASDAHRDPERVEEFLTSMGIEVNRMVDTPGSVEAALREFYVVDTDRVTIVAAAINDAICDEECDHDECEFSGEVVTALLGYADLARALGLAQ